MTVFANQPVPQTLLACRRQRTETATPLIAKWLPLDRRVASSHSSNYMLQELGHQLVRQMLRHAPS